jgi:2-polyprenyl-3-methyl-5-hydroxy-6-metoxy-1,4-benzoquinol methylase
MATVNNTIDGFQFDGSDPIGEKTLAAISAADNFNQWMYDTIKPFVKGHVFEVGSGIGNISQFFLQNGNLTTLTDLRQTYCDILDQKFRNYPNLKGILKVNLTHPHFESEYAHLLGTYDSIVAMNVVEHIEDDNLALANCYKLLAKGGHVIILVPAYQFLFNKFDVGLEHFRRYTKKRLTDLIAKNNFEIIHNQYFNAVGIAGWFVTGSVLKRETIPEGQMGLYNKLVPAIKVMDKLIFNQIGLSTICVGKKN